jgi:hypothetical protein
MAEKPARRLMLDGKDGWPTQARFWLEWGCPNINISAELERANSLARHLGLVQPTLPRSTNRGCLTLRAFRRVGCAKLANQQMEMLGHDDIADDERNQ